MRRATLASFAAATYPSYPRSSGSSSGGATQYVFVYRPGYTGTQPNIFSDWPTLMAAFGSVTGPREIEIDDSIISPAVIPANPALPGTWDLQEQPLTGPTKKSNALVGPFNIKPVHVQAVCVKGCVFVNLASIGGSLTLLSQSDGPVYTMLDGDVVDLSAWVGTLNFPFFDTPSNPSIGATINLYEGASLGAQTGNAAVQVENGQFSNQPFTVNMISAYASLDDNCLEGTINGFVLFQNYAAGTWAQWDFIFGSERNLPPVQPTVNFVIDDLTTRSRLTFGAQTISENVVAGNTDVIPFGFGQTSITDPSQEIGIIIDDTLFLQTMFLQAAGTNSPADAGKYLVVEVWQYDVAPGPTRLGAFSIQANNGAEGFEYINIFRECAGLLAITVTPSSTYVDTNFGVITPTTLSGPLTNLTFSIQT